MMVHDVLDLSKDDYEAVIDERTSLSASPQDKLLQTGDCLLSLPPQTRISCDFGSGGGTLRVVQVSSIVIGKRDPHLKDNFP